MPPSGAMKKLYDQLEQHSKKSKGVDCINEGGADLQRGRSKSRRQWDEDANSLHGGQSLLLKSKVSAHFSQVFRLFHVTKACTAGYDGRNNVDGAITQILAGL